uniref:Uncharacterized protein n=1 Tax=Rhizophora mucronata TaxID=61149 RepID=A0A2P2QXR3_RHIMU
MIWASHGEDISGCLLCLQQPTRENLQSRAEGKGFLVLTNHCNI